jgi:SPP1 family predicted phage head-tail adaptor
MIGIRFKFEVQSKASKSSDGIGGFTTSWSDDFNIFAKLTPISFNQVLKAQQAAIDISHIVTTKYDSRISVKNRLKMGARIFNIVSIENVEERNIEQQILVREEI